MCESTAHRGPIRDRTLLQFSLPREASSQKPNVQNLLGDPLLSVSSVQLDSHVYRLKAVSERESGIPLAFRVFSIARQLWSTALARL